MRLLKRPEEIRELQSLYAAPRFWDGRYLTFWFETDADVLRALLPPPLEPTGEPLATAWIGQVGDSDCVGGFLGAALFLRAHYGDIEGNYCLAMPMSTAEAVTFGRELYGEPKKLAAVSFQVRGDEVSGEVERRGAVLMRFRATLAEELPAGRRRTRIFHFKFLPRPDGQGFDHPPLLVLVHSDFDTRLVRRARGEISLLDSPYDPVADLPVRRITQATYAEGDIYTRGEVLCQVDPEAFLPYAFAKMDDLRLTAREAEERRSALHRRGR